MFGEKSAADELAARIRAKLGVDKMDEQSTEKIRYVIYTRKSTDRSELQQRSIGDQIQECKILAERIEAGRIPILHEEKSAKISDKRPIFRQMLDDTVQGKYDGIIAWAPDRLARNMKEGGEIIDLLDRGVIKDIKFANHYMFSNDPSGKMLLGIAFVMAKQYSDQHGQNVKRGFDHLTEDGKCGARSKHGYYKDARMFLRPDGENWSLIKHAFEMRLSRSSLKEIAEYLENMGYPLSSKHNKKIRTININVKFVSDLLRDPFFAGVLVAGDKVISLSSKYDFVPIITPEQFDQIASLDNITKTLRLTEAIKERGSVKADLLREMVICDHCSEPMSTGITPKKGKKGTTNYFYFRCDTIGCVRKGKSTRAKTILDAIFKFLKTHPMNMNEGYEAYLREMERLSVLNGTDVETRLQIFKQQRVGVLNRKESARQSMDEYAHDALLRKEFASEFRIRTKELIDINNQIELIRQEKIGKKSVNKSLAEFIELFNNLSKVIEKIQNMEDLDYVLKKVFSNFYVRDGKVTKITQNSPFRELCEASKPSDCILVVPRGIEPLFPG